MHQHPDWMACPVGYTRNAPSSWSYCGSQWALLRKPILSYLSGDKWSPKVSHNIIPIQRSCPAKCGTSTSDVKRQASQDFMAAWSTQSWSGNNSRQPSAEKSDLHIIWSQMRPSSKLLQQFPCLLYNPGDLNFVWAQERDNNPLFYLSHVFTAAFGIIHLMEAWWSDESNPVRSATPGHMELHGWCHHPPPESSMYFQTPEKACGAANMGLHENKIIQVPQYLSRKKSGMTNPFHLMARTHFFWQIKLKWLYTACQQAAPVTLSVHWWPFIS